MFLVFNSKAMEYHVTTTCSIANVDFYKGLSADQVVDYKKESVVEALKASGHKLDYAVDNVEKDK